MSETTTYFATRYRWLLGVTPRTGRYHPGMSWQLAELSHLAYEKFEVDVGRLRRPLHKGGFTLVSWYSTSSGTQAFLARRKDDAFSVLCFRGTDQARDWKGNLEIPRVEVGKVKVHEGFWELFGSIRGKLIPDLNKLAGIPVYLTGHSLGGALATLSAYFLPREAALSAVRFRACYTVGAPRAGNRTFARLMRTPVHRVVRYGDVVPEIPLGVRYKHAGQLYYFDRKGKVQSSIPWYRRSRKLVSAAVRDFGKTGLSAVKAHDHQAYAVQLGEEALRRLGK